MSVYEALSLMIAFGLFFIALLAHDRNAKKIISPSRQGKLIIF